MQVLSQNRVIRPSKTLEACIVFFLRKQRTSGKRGKNKVKTHNIPSFRVVCEFVINSDTSVFEISKGALKDIFISVDSERKIDCFCTKMKWKKKKKSREANYRDVDLTLIVKFSTNLVDYFQLTCLFQRYVLAVLQSQNNPIHMAKFVNDSPSHRLVFCGVILIQMGWKYRIYLLAGDRVITMDQL